MISAIDANERAPSSKGRSLPTGDVCACRAANPKIHQRWSPIRSVVVAPVFNLTEADGEAPWSVGPTVHVRSEAGEHLPGVVPSCAPRCLDAVQRVEGQCKHVFWKFHWQACNQVSSL